MSLPPMLQQDLTQELVKDDNATEVVTACVSGSQPASWFLHSSAGYQCLMRYLQRPTGELPEPNKRRDMSAKHPRVKASRDQVLQGFSLREVALRNREDLETLERWESNGWFDAKHNKVKAPREIPRPTSNRD